MSELERLRWQLGVSWSLLEPHLKDVTDEEALWEPASNCWNVRRRPDGTWAADWAVPEPEPAPVPTVAWAMWHIGLWWEQAYAHCFGPSGGSATQLDWSAAASSTPWPGEVASAVRWLNECHDRWTGALGSLSEKDLDSTERTGWFADGSFSLGHVFAWANVELMKNAAEIGTLRHLRRADGG
jgi:hypothetical protein